MNVLILAAVVQVQTNAVREVPIGKADRVISQDFTQIRGLRELPDGRVLLSDRLDKGVVVADFATNSVRVIGRTGRGPAEYRMPTTLTPLAGDSTLLSDEGNSRVAIIGPDLKIHRSFNVMLPGGSMAMGARSVDKQGRFYLQIPAWMSNPQSPNANDTIPIVRFDAKARKVDTLLRVKGMSWLPPGPRYGFGWVVFAPQDVWTVAADGRIAVVRSGDYHVEWYEPNGRVVRGPPVRFERIPVGMEERLAHVREFLDNSSIGGRDAEGALSPIPAEMKDEKHVREMATKNTFAETKGPFTDGPLLLGPDGTLWVERSVRLGDTPLWDVFDGSGEHVLRVRLPAKRQLAGVGARHLYVVATDDDGVQHLERYSR
ncbi:MAG TPA: hypothetical protein VGQ52_09270 [Gemmatimonadaceae bacterium]|nr:hypothetical protein [Gemmatimonadaceae bacterium]